MALQSADRLILSPEESIGDVIKTAKTGTIARKIMGLLTAGALVGGAFLLSPQIGSRERRGARPRRTLTGAEPRLAVVTPFYPGDAHLVGEGMRARWNVSCDATDPSRMSGGSSSALIDLVLYYSREEDDAARAVIESVPEHVKACVNSIRLISAGLTEEEDVYPMGPSRQFYDIFLDAEIAAQFAEYGSFAIMERDVTITSTDAFDVLYDLAFDADGHTPYWVKGGSLMGNEFHDSAKDAENWEFLGHINGNALYTLSDPAFTEYVKYTSMMHPPVPDSYPFDVALWAVISHFPYSWPLWQRYVHLFVHTNLMVNLGLASTSDLSSQQAIFVHGSLHSRSEELTMAPATASACPSTACGDSSLTVATCDETCLPGPGQRWGGYGCGANGFSQECRACYTDLAEALEADKLAVKTGGRAIMCDTRMPPVHPLCPHGCGSFVSSEEGRLSLLHGVKGTVCDTSCSAAGNDTSALPRGCNAAGLGQNCRFCHMDEDDALMAMYGGKSSLMCGTLQAPPGAAEADSEQGEAHGRHLLLDPKWKRTCNPSCPITFTGDLIGRGRACDPSCKPSNRQSYCNYQHMGLQCRKCWTDTTRALKAIANGKTNVVMCDTLEPPIVYRRLGDSRRRRLEENSVTEKLQEGNGANTSICIFTRAYLEHMPYLEVSVESARKYMPGAAMVVAVQEADLTAWQEGTARWTKATTFTCGGGGGGAVCFVPLGGDSHTYSELWADEHCGAPASLIYYLPTGAVFTRTPFPLDLFRVSGELLVSHIDYDRLGPIHLHWRLQNLQLLGFPTPSFTHGQDVLLPSSLNARLRAAMAARFDNDGGGGRGGGSGHGGGGIAFLEQLKAFGDVFNAVELLGAFAYTTSPPSIFFQDATTWGRMHAATDVESIWEIPLVKPPYTCRGNMRLAEARGAELATALRDAVSGTNPCPHGWSVLEDAEWPALG